MPATLDRWKPLYLCTPASEAVSVDLVLADTKTAERKNPMILPPRGPFVA